MTASEAAETTRVDDDPATPESDAASSVDLKKQLDHAEDQWRRTAADLDNLQKRFQREVERGRLDERERVLSVWIQSIDDLHRSLDHSAPGESPFVLGIRSILDRADASLQALGYTRFGAVGDEFDPAIHDVISTVPATEGTTANQVAAVVKPGYRGADRLLRPASVVVAAEAT